MISRDYTQEVGISSPKKTLPRPVAFAVLAVLAGGITFGISRVISATKVHNASEKALTEATSVAPAAPVPAPAEAPSK